MALFESSPEAAQMRAMVTARSIMRSHVSGLITLTFVFSFVLVTSCCEIGFLAPLSFSMHSAESIELRLEVVLCRRSFQPVARQLLFPFFPSCKRPLARPLRSTCGTPARRYFHTAGPLL